MLKRVLDFRSLILPISKLQVRNVWVPVYKPVPGVNGNYFRRVIHWKDEYTVEPLETTHLGGRDPETGNCLLFLLFSMQTKLFLQIK